MTRSTEEVLNDRHVCDRFESIIRGCTTYADSLALTTAWMRRLTSSDTDHDVAQAAQAAELLAVLVTAAMAVREYDIRRIARWLLRWHDDRDRAEIRSCLQYGQYTDLVDKVNGLFEQETSTQDGIVAVCLYVLTEAAQSGNPFSVDQPIIYLGIDTNHHASLAIDTASKFLRSLCDDRGNQLLARDVRVIADGLDEDFAREARLCIDANFHEISVDDLIDQINANSRKIRVPEFVPASSYETAEDLVEHWMKKRQRPLLIIARNSQLLMQHMHRMRVALSSPSEWSCPVIFVDMSSAQEREEARQDLSFCSHYLAVDRDQGIVLHPFDGCHGADISYTAFANHDLDLEHTPTKDEASIADFLNSLPEAEDMDDDSADDEIPIQDFAMARLSRAGRDALYHAYGIDRDSAPVELLVRALIGHIYRIDIKPQYSPLIVLDGAPSGLVLQQRYAPSLNALLVRMQTDQQANIAWARISDREVPKATVEAAAGWLGRARIEPWENLDGEPIGEVIVVDIELSDYLKDKENRMARVIIPSALMKPQDQ